MVTGQALHHAVYPSPLHYKGFPRTCCTSVNNIIAHGIPDKYTALILLSTYA